MFQVLFLIFKIHDDTKNGKKKVRVAQKASNTAFTGAEQRRRQD